MALRRKLRYLTVVLVAALLSAMAASTIAAQGEANSPARGPAPVSLLKLEVDPARCYRPDARVRLAVSGAPPRAAVNVLAEDTTSVTIKTDAAGRGVGVLSAPSGLPGRQRFAATMVSASVQIPDGGARSVQAAFLLGTAAVCRSLKPHAPG